MIEFRAAEVTAASADAVVVGVREGRRYDDVAGALLARMPWLPAHLDDVEFTGKVGQVAVMPAGEGGPYRRVVLVGLGDAPDHEQARRAAGSAARSLNKSATVATTLHSAVPGAAEAVGCGFALGAYSYTKHKSEPKPSALGSVILIGASPEEVAAAAVGGVIATGVNLARDLINEPALGKAPAVLADRAVAMAAEVGVVTRVLDEKQIVAERLGGLHGVSLGATNPPRLVELRYEPPGATGFLALVGKGIVFDSGGLSLKPADSMETMKTDMSGAAAVFAAMRTIAALKIPVRVVGIAPLTENMPGGAALRPGDVLRARNGKTIEVLNTDAEGRLILADGLSLAAEMKPDLIVDLATLTGAISIALGEKIAGLFGTDGATETVAAAALAAGERVWRMPLPADYRKNIDSEVADMKNTGTKYGGAISAALLLKEFVGDIPWAHLDIAGPARSTEAEHYVAKGGTGFGVRTLVELARRMSTVAAPAVE